MNGDPKQQKQMLILFLLFLGLGVAVYFNMFAGSGTPEPGVKPASQVGAADDSDSPDGMVISQTGSGRRDPFQPPMAYDEIERERPVEPPVSRPIRPVPQPPTAFRNTPPAAGLPVLPPAGVTQVEPSEPPALRISGVVQGDRSLAIVASPEGDHLVEKGQMLAGGYRLAEIHADRVVVVRGGRRYAIPVGGPDTDDR